MARGTDGGGGRVASMSSMEAKKGMAEGDGAAGAPEAHMKPKNGKGSDVGGVGD